MAENKRAGRREPDEMRARIHGIDRRIQGLIGNFMPVDSACEAAPLEAAVPDEDIGRRPMAGYGPPTRVRIAANAESESPRLLQAQDTVLR